MRSVSVTLRVICTLAMLAAALACGKKSSNPLAPSAEPTLQSVDIVGKTDYVVGETLQLRALARYSDGTQQDVTAQAQWSDFGSGAISVSASGLLEALAVGRCGVLATYQNVSGKLAVKVGLAPPDSGPGTPDPDPDPAPDPDPDPGRDPGPDSGVSLIGLALQGVPSVDVGQTIAWQAVALFNNGTERSVTTSATWSSGAPMTAAVERGVITGLTAGTASISAAYQGRQASSVVQVTQPGGPVRAVSAVTLTGNTSIEVGQTTQLDAVAHFNDGTTQTVTASASWSSANGAAASVVGGLVSGLAPGAAQITASYDGRSASTTVQINAASVTSLDVTGATTLRTGESTQWQAIAHYGNGSSQVVTGSAVWTSGTPSVATVSAGLVTGGSAGSSQIAAAFGGRSGSGTVTVSATPPASSTITIVGAPCATVGQSAQLTARLDGQDVTTQVTWATGNAGVVTVSAAGLLSCVGVGSTSVTASLASHTPGSLAVTVAAAPVDLIGLEVHVAGDVLTGNGPLGLDLDLADLLNGNPLLDLTAYGLYSDGSRQEVTSLATVNCPTVPNPVVPCIVGLDGMGTVDVVTLLLQGLLMSNHPVNVSYGGYTANLVVDLKLPVLQSIGFTTGSTNLKAGNQLPALAGLFSQGISSSISSSLPQIDYEIALADTGLVGLIGSIPLVGGGLVSALNTVVGGVSVVGGVVELTAGASTALNDLLDNAVVRGLLGGSSLPLAVTAEVDGIRTTSPLLLNLGR